MALRLVASSSMARATNTRLATRGLATVAADSLDRMQSEDTYNQVLGKFAEILGLEKQGGQQYTHMHTNS